MSSAHNGASGDWFPAVGDASKRMAEWDEDQADQRRRRLTKVTEVVGEHRCGMEFDGVEPDAQDPFLTFDDMVPPDARGKRGRWRITVEFEPEEER